MNPTKQFDDDDDTISEIPNIIEDVDHTQHEEPTIPMGSTWGLSVSGTDLLFKIDNKTIKKVAMKSLKKLDVTNADHFRELISEFRINGADAAVKKFKS